jgi:integrase
MPSLKFVVRKDEINSDGKSNIKCRVSHNRKVRYIATPYYIEPRYMASDGKIKSNYDGQSSLNGALISLDKDYNNIIRDIGTDIYSIDINNLVGRLKIKQKYGSSFTQYMNSRIKDLEKERRFSYATSYRVTTDRLREYIKRDLEFKDITISFLKGFRSHLRQVNHSRINTCRIYLNNIRAVFYHAIDADIIKADLSPFRKFKIEQEKTKPRPLSIKEMKQLLALRSRVTKKQARAIDLFFLMFYLLGINMKDLIFLKPGDLYKGRIYYKRFKTVREYSVKVFPQAKEIIDRYQGEKYLLCLMDWKKISAGRAHEADADILHQVNKLLKTVARNFELPFKPTTYSARYSWATIAAKLDINRDVISHALGHGIDTMTDGYIDYELEKVDQANEKVIGKFKRLNYLIKYSCISQSL